MKQQPIPVALKRKFIYKENVMEEIVDKDKVNKYFEYFKKALSPKGLVPGL